MVAGGAQVEVTAPQAAEGAEADGPARSNSKAEIVEDADERRVAAARGPPRPYLEIETGSDDEADQLEKRISINLTPLSQGPLSTKSTDSSVEYANPNQTIIIFDWDDTLCPSTTCMRRHGLSVLGDPPTGELAESLEVLAGHARRLLEQAMQLAQAVVVVTNAEDGWVDLSCKAWMPSLQATLEKVELISARSNWEHKGVASPAGWKAKAFEDAIDKFYSRYAGQSWKNVISIGDAPHEREALHRVVRWSPFPKSSKCRSKSVKFVLRPSIENLGKEQQMLLESIEEIVNFDDDLDLHFSAESLADFQAPAAAAS